MSNDHRFDKSITIELKLDTAIVLFLYLHRELYGVEDEKNLRASFVHAAEVHSLLALHQELFRPLVPLGVEKTTEEAETLERSAREHLLRRYT